MSKTLLALACAGLIGGALLLEGARAQTTSAPTAQAPQPAHYTVSETLVGKLLDDPAAVAVLKEIVPTVCANDQFQTAGRALTLKDIQQYEPEALSDANLAKIQAAFDKIPVKR